MLVRRKFMNTKYLGSRADKILFEFNNIPMPAGKMLEIKPHFVRNVKKNNEDDRRLILQLICEIKSTSQTPTPFNLTVEYSAVYEVEFDNQYEERSFVIDVTKQLYTTIRQVIANITSNAGINAIFLPMQTNSIFPEDEEIDMGSANI